MALAGVKQCACEKTIAEDRSGTKTRGRAKTRPEDRSGEDTRRPNVVLLVHVWRQLCLQWSGDMCNPPATPLIVTVTVIAIEIVVVLVTAIEIVTGIVIVAVTVIEQ